MIESIVDGLGAAFLTAYKTLIYPHVHGHIDRRTLGARTSAAPPFKAVFPDMELNGLHKVYMRSMLSSHPSNRHSSSVIATLRLLVEEPGGTLHFDAISPHLVTISQQKRHAAFFGYRSTENRHRVPDTINPRIPITTVFSTFDSVRVNPSRGVSIT